MGGVHIYDEDGEPVGPLTPSDAINLITSGSILLPPLQRINGQSETTGGGKLFAVVVLLHFVGPCITRAIQGLPLATIEIMALAHTLIAIMTFMPWWSKPMNVECPSRVSVEAFPESQQASFTSARSQRLSGDNTLSEIVYAYIVGGQDSLFDLSKAAYVPTFWSGDPTSVFSQPSSSGPAPSSQRSAHISGTAFGLLAAIFFGLIHFIGWKNSSSNAVERVVWRFGAVLVTCSPAVVIIVYIACIFPLRFNRYDLPRLWMEYTTVPCAALYATGRLMLIAIVLFTTWNLPTEVYVQGSWRFIPLK